MYMNHVTDMLLQILLPAILELSSQKRFNEQHNFLALKYTEYIRHWNVHTIFFSKLLRGHLKRILFTTDNLSAYLIV
jgi:hypothetical protein